MVTRTTFHRLHRTTRIVSVALPMILFTSMAEAQDDPEIDLLSLADDLRLLLGDKIPTLSGRIRGEY